MRYKALIHLSHGVLLLMKDIHHKTVADLAQSHDKLSNPTLHVIATLVKCQRKPKIYCCINTGEAH